MHIHPTAVIEKGAEIGEGVEIGPFCHIGPRVRIGEGTTLGAHVVIEGTTHLGQRNRISPFVSLGSPPHDVGYAGEDTRLTIGDDNTFREFVTINRATTKQDWETVVGSRLFLMAYAHIAHDCMVGDDVIMANGATLGGHTQVGHHANFGAFVAVHQFVRIGTYAFLGARCGIDRDVPPFMLTAGERAKLYGVNRKGLPRQGFSQACIDGLKIAYRILWKEGRRLEDGIAEVTRVVPPSPEITLLLDFLRGSKRGVLR